jgi:hypothetical protein
MPTETESKPLTAAEIRAARFADGREKVSAVFQRMSATSTYRLLQAEKHYRSRSTLLAPEIDDITYLKVLLDKEMSRIAYQLVSLEEGSFEVGRLFGLLHSALVSKRHRDEAAALRKEQEKAIVDAMTDKATKSVAGTEDRSFIREVEKSIWSQMKLTPELRRLAAKFNRMIAMSGPAETKAKAKAWTALQAASTQAEYNAQDVLRAVAEERTDTWLAEWQGQQLSVTFREADAPKKPSPFPRSRTKKPAKRKR